MCTPLLWATIGLTPWKPQRCIGGPFTNWIRQYTYEIWWRQTSCVAQLDLSIQSVQGHDLVVLQLPRVPPTPLQQQRLCDNITISLADGLIVIALPRGIRFILVFVCAIFLLHFAFDYLRRCCVFSNPNWTNIRQLTSVAVCCMKLSWVRSWTDGSTSFCRFIMFKRYRSVFRRKRYRFNHCTLVNCVTVTPSVTFTDFVFQACILYCDCVCTMCVCVCVLWTFVVIWLK